MLTLLHQVGMPSLGAGTVEQAREAFHQLTAGTRFTAPPVGGVEDVADGPVPLRVYRPEGEPTAAIAFFHGGGFVIGSIETHDAQVRRLCRDTGAVVVSAEYRLAPEHPWPAAVEDCLAAADWVLERFDGLAVAVAGDSAGGNLAAIVAQQRRDRIAAQLLIYPATDLTEDDDGVRYPSRVDNAEGFFLTQADMRFFEAQYAAQAPDRRDPTVSPRFGDLAGLPPAVVVTAEFDPLRDEGDAYAAALAEAGVRVEHRRFDGLIHGFFGFAVPSCDAAAAETCGLLRDLLA